MQSESQFFRCGSWSPEERANRLVQDLHLPSLTGVRGTSPTYLGSSSNALPLTLGLTLLPPDQYPGWAVSRVPAPLAGGVLEGQRSTVGKTSPVDEGAGIPWVIGNLNVTQWWPMGCILSQTWSEHSFLKHWNGDQYLKFKRFHINNSGLWLFLKTRKIWQLWAEFSPDIVVSSSWQPHGLGHCPWLPVNLWRCLSLRSYTQTGRAREELTLMNFKPLVLIF